MQYRLDTTAYRCPLPLLMVKNALLDLQVNDELQVLLNTESAIDDFKSLCELSNCFLTMAEDSSVQQVLIIRKIG